MLRKFESKWRNWSFKRNSKSKVRGKKIVVHEKILEQEIKSGGKKLI